MGKHRMGEIRSRGDVRELRDRVNTDGLTRASTTALAQAVRPAGETELVPRVGANVFGLRRIH